MKIKLSSASALHGFQDRLCFIRKEVLRNIITEFGIPIQLVRPIKLRLNETCSRVWVGKHLSDMFPVKNGLKQGHALSPLLFNVSFEYSLRRVKVNSDGLKLKSTY
jgi:hypothetical protein